MSERLDPAQRLAIDRPLGWLIAIGGCILIADQLLAYLPLFADFAPWWNAGALAVTLSFVLLAGFGRILPLAVLDVVWRAIPLGYLALQASWVLGLADGVDVERAGPWLWVMEPAVIILLMLFLRPVVAVVVGFCFAFGRRFRRWRCSATSRRRCSTPLPPQLNNAL